MKKYLNKDIFKIQIILFLVSFGIFSVSLNVFAQTKLDYYKKLFAEDFEFIISEESQDTSLGVGSTPSDLNDGYLVLLSSSISKEKTLENYFVKNKKIILVCDKPYSTTNPIKFSCDKSNVFSSELENTAGFLRKTWLQGTDLYVIPENILVSPDERSNIEEYFNAFRRSDAVPSISEDKNTVFIKVLKKIDQVKVLLKTSTFETFGIAFSMFLIVSISFGFLKFLSGKNKKKLNSSVFKVTLIKIKDYFALHHWVVVYGLIILTTMYIPIIVTLGVKDGRGVSLGYFITYSLDTFKLTNLITYIDQGNYFRVVIFFYNFIYLITLITLFVPSLITTLLIAFPRIENAKLKTETHKYAVPLLVALSLIASSFFEISDSYRFLIFTSVVLAFIILNNLKYKTFSYKYTYREKMFIIIISFLIILSGFLMKAREKEIGLNYKEEDLIGVNDKVVTLPYSKQLGDNVIFNDYLVSMSDPVFADRYLVYSPNYPSVENKNALEFKNLGPFYIQNGVLSDMVSAIYANEELSKALTLKTPSNFFKVIGFENKSGKDNAKIQITFTCEIADIGLYEIVSNYYYVNADGEVKDSDKLLLYFPGCSKVGEPETFTVEFKPPYIESDSFFMRLQGLLGKDIKDIKILALENKIIEPIYYSKGRGYSVIASGGLTSSASTKITNYIFPNSDTLSKDFYNLSFDVEFDSEGKFNISKPINELVKQGVLKDTFLIWSTIKYVPIRLDE